MIGSLLCWLGLHKWRPVPGTEGIDYQSKWVIYETAAGECERDGCIAEADEIRRDYYW